MVRAKWLAIGFVAVWIGNLVAGRGNAERYDNASLHFSLTLPDGWQPMDEAQLQELNTNEANPGGPAAFIAGFVPDDASEIPGAQILLSFERLPMKDVTYDDLIAQLKSTLASHLKFVVEKEDGPAKAPKVGEARLDRNRHRVVLRARPQATEFGSLHSYTVVALGNEGMVSVNGFDVGDEFQLALPEFQSIADTLQFDAGHEFEPASAPATRTRSSSWIKLVVFAVIFVGSAIAAWIKKQNSDKRKARLPEKIEWVDP